MLKFEDISLSHKKYYDKSVAKEDYLNSINDFNFFYLWNTKNNVQITFTNDLTIIKGVWNNKTFFYSPSLDCYDTFKSLLNEIIEYQAGKDFYFAGIPAYIVSQVDCLQECCSIEFDRNASDYIYKTSDLMSLSGKKFHAKKNHVNSFIKSYKYDFVEYDESYYQKILDLYDKWMSNSEHKVDPNERIAITTAMNDYKQLGLKIGILLVDNDIAAFTMSAISKFNVAQVFFEKADTQYKGIYAMINYINANQFLSQTEFINREEDMGIEGLRKAKLSYNPDTIYEKYILRYKNEQV